MIKRLMQFILIVVIIFIVTSIPSMFGISNKHGEAILEFHPEDMFMNIPTFFTSLQVGTFGTYSINGVAHSVLNDIQSFSKNSAILLFSSILVALLFSLIFGVFLSYLKMTKLFRWFINIFSIIPDFIIIIFSIAVAVEFYKWTNIRVITLSPFSESVNLWFPISILSLMPTFYLFKMISSRYIELSGMEYIRTAVGKGLDRHYINGRHILKNLIPYIFADLKKALSFTIGNLFIIEYLFNIKGLTIFIFADYQFQKVFLSLLILLAIATLCYLFIKLLFYMIERVFINA
ncbi:ABC transporter permease subunit [Heyndrickxia vini]|uniref:ABC transporter permease subunit n=1 Tax=Heyndrickxia vini TaxID=1476025 RepID=A0ABX7E6F7_9BACI|nr:ABC transporter permease subunit [Heyndrickxia vini]QQZ11303.1 ABC transporter permease subunit [Heyndrickxia vini]